MLPYFFCSFDKVNIILLKMTQIIKLNQDINLENYTLILPSVAVGNVGQLSVDLLISNLKLYKIGQAFTAAFVPIVGANAYHEHINEIITAIDIYAGIKERVVVMQIRSPYIDNLSAFFDNVAQFVTSRKIAKVIILTSSYDYEKTDTQLQHKLRYIASPNIYSKYGKFFDNLNWIPHKPKIASDISGQLHIPGGGFAKNIFNFLSDTNISCAILFKFCSEGDNIADATALVFYLDQWIRVLRINTKDLKYPLSWKHLFGNPTICDIY